LITIKEKYEKQRDIYGIYEIKLDEEQRNVKDAKDELERLKLEKNNTEGLIKGLESNNALLTRKNTDLQTNYNLLLDQIAPAVAMPAIQLFPGGWFNIHVWPNGDIGVEMFSLDAEGYYYKDGEAKPSMKLADCYWDEKNQVLIFNKIVLIDGRVVPNRLFRVGFQTYIGEEVGQVKIEYTQKLPKELHKYVKNPRILRELSL
jgi:hypothetical protein